jgi:hypothetical protein
LPISREDYERIWHDAVAVRRFVDEQIRTSPELFPESMEVYRLTGFLPESIKMEGIRLRQVRVRGETYTLRPSFVLPYMTGYVSDIEYPLRLMAYGVPPWLIAMRFGRDANYWDRQIERLGRNSLVGATVGVSEKMPEHLVADEHHTCWSGEKGIVAMTAGEGCILGVELVLTPSDVCLAEAYGVFAQEARDVDPHYTPKTVNTDGWPSTQNAWRTLYPLAALIRCIMHGFFKIRERCHKQYDYHQRIWDVYRAWSAEEFRTRMKALQEWMAKDSTLPGAVRAATEKFCQRIEEYVIAYDHPGCRRTSNMVDRLMNRVYRKLYAQRGLHGHQRSSGRRLRGWALIHNFCPFAPRAGCPREHSSPAHRLRGKQYSENWLENLQISASLQGRKTWT